MSLSTTLRSAVGFSSIREIGRDRSREIKCIYLKDEEVSLLTKASWSLISHGRGDQGTKRRVYERTDIHKK